MFQPATLPSSGLNNSRSRGLAVSDARCLEDGHALWVECGCTNKALWRKTMPHLRCDGGVCGFFDPAVWHFQANISAALVLVSNLESEHHQIDWEGAAIMDHASRRRELSIKEVLHIQQHHRAAALHQRCSANWPGWVATLNSRPSTHTTITLKIRHGFFAPESQFFFFSPAVPKPTLHP